MNYFIDRALCALRKSYRVLTLKKRKLMQVNPNALEGQEASDLIYEVLSQDKPCMISRFGCVELNTIMEYLTIHNKDKNTILKYIDFLFKNGHAPFYSFTIKHNISNNAGFFPVDIVMSNDERLLDKFCELNINCVHNVDILGSWLYEELLLQERMPNTKYVPLGHLEPYNHLNPWSRILKDRKVLVIHPFADTIIQQYKNREKLFKNPHVLPEFNLKIIKAVQSMAGNVPEGYSDWFYALEDMKNKISEKDFDIALIGCGAYGFPLASFVKELGKKSVHLGGALQILFGIKGRRWETEYDYDKKFYNEYWVTPSENDKPKNYKKVENGCYW